MKTCQKCQTKSGSRAKACSKCGTEFEAKEKKVKAQKKVPQIKEEKPPISAKTKTKLGTAHSVDDILALLLATKIDLEQELANIDLTISTIRKHSGVSV